MPAYYPVFLDLRNRRVVVIGGNLTAQEKVSRLVEYGADVVVISIHLTEGLTSMADDELTWIPRRYEPGDLDGAFIAIVTDTSDSQMNRAVSKEARERNVPLNVADVTDLCTWIAPAVVRRGDVVVATSTGGASPALARRFREQLSGTTRIDSRHDLMALADLAPLLSEARHELASRGVRLNPDHWQACLTDELADLVQSGKTKEALDHLIYNLIVGAECKCEDGVCRIWEDLVQTEGAEQASSDS